MAREDPDLAAQRQEKFGPRRSALAEPGLAEPGLARPEGQGVATPAALRAIPSPRPASPDPAEARLDTLFLALADPTRRAVLARLSSGPLPVGKLAEPFAMALPSFMEHLRRLEAGGLIETWKEGRSRLCRLRPGAISPVRDWVEVQRGLWEARLDNLEDYLATLLKENPE